jgi:hypothetical protein
MMKKFISSSSKKGSLEVSVNFIVVMIVCVLLLMMGLYFVNKAQNAFEEEYEKIRSIRESQAREALSKSGQPVIVYPSNIQINRGDGYIFSLGVLNQLGSDQDFVVYVVDGSVSNPANEVLYSRGAPSMRVKNTQTGFIPIKITTAKDRGQVAYTFNVCVYPVASDPGAGCPQVGMYGDLQKIIVNVR